jgi:hypothetical protein
MKQLQISALSPKTVRDALKGADKDIVIYDGEEPLVRLVSVSSEMKRRADFLLHFPHEAIECFNSCWRHNGSAEQEQSEQPEQVADVVPEPAAV